MVRDGRAYDSIILFCGGRIEKNIFGNEEYIFEPFIFIEGKSLREIAASTVRLETDWNWLMFVLSVCKDKCINDELKELMQEMTEIVAEFHESSEHRIYHRIEYFVKVYNDELNKNK